MKTPTSWLTHIAMLLTILFWASAFVGIRAGLHGYTPGALALFRYGVASICMMFLYFRLPKKTTFEGLDFFKLFALGIFGFAIYNVTLNLGERSVPAGIASFVVSLIPVCMTIFAVIFLKERLSKLAWLGIFISFMGIVIIAIGEHAGMKFDVGVVWVIMTTISGAIYSIGQKPLLTRFHAIEINAYAIWFGTIAMLVFLPQLLHQIPRAPWTATMAAIYMGIFPAAIAYVAWSYVLKSIPASHAASYLYFLPIVTTLMGWFLLGEIPALVSLIGGIIAIVGAGLLRYAKIT